jgi:hypothetical protein
MRQLSSLLTIRPLRNAGSAHAPSDKRSQARVSVVPPKPSPSGKAPGQAGQDQCCMRLGVSGLFGKQFNASAVQAQRFNLACGFAPHVGGSGCG